MRWCITQLVVWCLRVHQAARVCAVCETDLGQAPTAAPLPSASGIGFRERGGGSSGTPSAAAGLSKHDRLATLLDDDAFPSLDTGADTAKDGDVNDGIVDSGSDTVDSDDDAPDSDDDSDPTLVPCPAEVTYRLQVGGPVRQRVGIAVVPSDVVLLACFRPLFDTRVGRRSTGTTMRTFEARCCVRAPAVVAVVRQLPTTASGDGTMTRLCGAWTGTLWPVPTDGRQCTCCSMSSSRGSCGVSKRTIHTQRTHACAHAIVSDL